ncbi:hypothetical protein [Pseudomonas sp. NFIX28]|jgi:hypothetical protein|nr:hypothetical protein [Pseudomonas sp. NFIX28]
MTTPIVFIVGARLARDWIAAVLLYDRVIVHRQQLGDNRFAQVDVYVKGD